jgi:hypothetical protein
MQASDAVVAVGTAADAAAVAAVHAGLRPAERGAGRSPVRARTRRCRWSPGAERVIGHVFFSPVELRRASRLLAMGWRSRR